MKTIEKLSMGEIITRFVERFPQYYKDMNAVEHGFKGEFINPHHIEGSIWTHTMLVMKEVDNARRNGKINDDETFMVHALAALCHDIGKAYCYVDIEDKARRRFSNHEGVSVVYAKEVLGQFEMMPFMMTRILTIVAKHGVLYPYFEDERISDKNKDKLAQSLKYDNIQDLIRFFEFDHYGRFNAHDLGNVDGSIMDLYDIKGRAEKLAEEDRHTKVITGQIVIMVGPPRAGKSTYIESAKRPDTVVISRDDLVMKYGTGDNYSEKWRSLTDEQQKMIDSEITKSYDEALRNEVQHIIIDMTNMSKKSRSKWVNHPKARNYFREAVLVLETPKVLLSRNTPEKFIPENVIHSMLRNLTYPDFTEVNRVTVLSNMDKGVL
jgi:predicted kinase